MQFLLFFFILPMLLSSYVAVLLPIVPSMEGFLFLFNRIKKKEIRKKKGRTTSVGTLISENHRATILFTLDDVVEAVFSWLSSQLGI